MLQFNYFNYFNFKNISYKSQHKSHQSFHVLRKNKMHIVLKFP